jgi:hypothetical protein
MTVEEALADIEIQSCDSAISPSSEQELPCRDTKQAVRLLAEAYEHLRTRDPLYGGRRRSASLVPPPASVPPD